MPEIPPSTDDPRQLLRGRLRAQRRALPCNQRRSAALAAARHIRQLGAFQRARRVGVFFAADGEIPVTWLLSEAQRWNKQLYVPVLIRQGLGFAPLDRHSELRPNRFGIPEPVSRERLDPRRLDVVLTPLVAFDDRGARLGMGGGYYDRCFRFLRHRAVWSKPKLIGVGYEFQRLTSIEVSAWDVGLWCAVTDAGTYHF